MARQRIDDGGGALRGNFVSEWFGHRVYPTVAGDTQILADQRTARCPFLSEATSTDTVCVKSAASKGICTISSASNGPRQDWLVCPHRAVTSVLLEAAARRLFSIETARELLAIPAPVLANPVRREELSQMLQRGSAAVVYFQNRLGGEISVSATEHSPEVSFDVTMVEMVLKAGRVDIEKYGILEVQTMDFHGSYRRAVDNLSDALRLHGGEFHERLRENRGRWLSEKIEGPNIANVFKRTFYQMMLKFQIGAHESAAGCVLAIPASVWDSWQRHLGGPELTSGEGGTFTMARSAENPPPARAPAWIYVFDVDASGAESPNQLKIVKMIATDADSVAHYAVKVAPEAAVEHGGSGGNLVATIRRRLSGFWPDLGT